MEFKPNELARRDGPTMVWRKTPLRASWAFDQLISIDSHSMEAAFECSVRIAAHDGDRAIFAETFLNHSDPATLEQIQRHLKGPLREALTRLVAEHPATELVDPGRQNEWVEPLRKSLDSAAFTCGLELMGPMQLSFSSRSLLHQKMREIAGTRQREELDRATEFLKQFQAMRAAAPEVSPGRLLNRFDPQNRGDALRSLMLADSAQSGPSTLWAVSGPHLVEVQSPLTKPDFSHSHSLPDEAGPLRSVQPVRMEGRPVLLIGAQRGVMIAEAANPGQCRVYMLPGIDSPQGFNRVVADSRFLWASHGQAGIVRWSISDPAAPPVVYDEREARNLAFVDEESLIYSTGPTAILRHGENRTVLHLTGESPIVGIFPSAHAVAIVREDGTLQVVELPSLRLQQALQRGSSVRSAGVMPWLEDIRLLLATDQGPVDCIGLDDPLVTQYLSAHRGLRMLTATREMIAAASPDRQRIVIWNTWDSQRPVGEIHVTGRTRHRIADIRFG